MRLALFLSSALLLAGCAAKQAATTSSTSATTVVKTSSSEPNWKFSFRMSGSGLTNVKPFDLFIMDTNHIMGVHTSRRVGQAKFKEVTALAELEPIDFDTLRQLILKGKLYQIDSTDLTQQCPEDELYQVDIVPLAAIKPVRLAFSACATDYNLLLQPEREYFAKLVAWFERMRVKYRPNQPD